ncbi:MAG: hypothetical protein IIB05_05945 [Bacteroidetes bacterium]|nr:hypothetical protein [Bacteroidota bacterium]
MKKKRSLRLLLNIFLIISVVTVMSSCSDEETTGPDCPDLTGAPTLNSAWVSFVNWDAATKIEIIAEEVDESNMHYTPSNIQLIAGMPYILTLKVLASNQEKHYFHSPDFFKAIATRKVQTTSAEYKAPYFDDIELVLNGEAELFFVPVIAGTYDLWCTITGHQAAGMEMTLEIACGDGLSLDLEVDPNFNTALGSDARRSGGHAVWDTKQEIEVTLVENSQDDYAFSPDTIILSADQAYVLKIKNPATNSSKHYFTAPEFFQSVVTRKAEDPRAEIKVPYFKAVEILIGSYTELFIVPTVPGTYALECTITGHAAAGMVGTIIVQ